MTGECRRFPRQVVSEYQTDGFCYTDCLYPLHHADDWCGEFVVSNPDESPLKMQCCMYCKYFVEKKEK